MLTICTLFVIMKDINLLLFLFLACLTIASAQDFQFIEYALSDIPSSSPVQVSCVFDNSWTEVTHPIDYPSSSAHWSPMVLVSHSNAYEMWTAGTMASDGIQSVAETGATETLLTELENAGDNVLNSVTGRTIFLNSETQVTMDPLEMDASHSFLSTIAMIAPSPDWFSGMSDFNLIIGDVWYQNFTLTTFPWDAGTDDGDTYAAANQASNPQVDIFKLTAESIPDTNVFLNPTDDAVEPVATWTCTVAAVDGGVPVTSSTEMSNVVTTTTTTLVSDAPVDTTTSGIPVDTTTSDTPAMTTTTRAPVAPPTQATSSAPSTAVGIESLVPTGTPVPSAAPPPTFDIKTVPGNTPTAINVKATCAFLNQWTAARHPNDYPAESLWSPMVMASHSSEYQMWGFPGVLASDGVKLIAETGNTSTLITEMNSAGTNVLDQQFGPPMPIDATRNQSSLIGPLLLDSSHPFISSISMSAPSPDWFTGFYNFPLINNASDTWYESFEIESYPWDAGTDSGDTYLADNRPIDPPLWIYQLTADTVPPTDVFLDPSGSTVLPVAVWNCIVEPVETMTDDELTSGALPVLSGWVCRLLPVVVAVISYVF